MNFNNLLKNEGIDPQHVIVLRHRPREPELNKVLPWLAAEKPDVFNAYQQTQGKKLEKAMEKMSRVGYVASFIGHQPGKALFIGLYTIGITTQITRQQYWQIPAYQEMKLFGMRGLTEAEGRQNVLWFDLALTKSFAYWKGKLIVSWPPPERSWWRRAHRNDFPILAILEESALNAVMPTWDNINLSWEELSVIPSSWKDALSQWRGVYYIFDTSVGKGYVGVAYGAMNFYGRWLAYAAHGHGGNKMLKSRDPRSFRFSILQRVSPDMQTDEIVRLESSWKERLHTRTPYGLNDN